MTEFTRVTVVGTTRKAELVVPNDESIGALIPQLMDLLDEATSSVARPLTLVRSTGEQLDLALSAAQQLVRDGELLRLLRIEDAPPPPEVSDVTDVVADSLARRPGLWSPAFRRGTGAVAVAALALVAATALATEPVDAVRADIAGTASQFGASVMLAPVAGAWVVLVLAAVLFGALRLTWSNLATTAAAIGVAIALGPTIVAAVSTHLSPTIGLGASLLLGWITVGLGAGVARRSRPQTLGAIVGVLATALPIVLLAAGMPALGAFGITAIAAVAAVGLIPWYAMSASGLTGLDDQIVEGARPKRAEVLVTVTGAYSAMSWAVAGLAIPAAVSASVLVASDDGWAIALGVAVVLVLALRTRAFPLASQSVVLWASALVPTIVGIVVQSAAHPVLGAAAAALAAVVVCVLVGARPANHQRARMRRLGNLLEGLSVIALLPLLLGVFALYAQLLGAF